MMKVAETFDRFAQSYDEDRRKLIPRFDDFYGTLTAQIPFPESAPVQILDIGAGTGLVSGMLSQKFTWAHFTLTDILEKMLSQARERFANSERHQFKILNSLDLAFDSQFDAVVSALSIHHLANDEKTALYQKIYRALKLDGIFINADQVLGPTPELERQYHEHWLTHIYNSGNTEEKIQGALERVKIDLNAPLADNLNWLSAAGFTNVDCWFKYYRFAVFGGEKGR
ncbi:MAG: class I SAM-dependent methyltransferase [Verrucomicrobiales bacterium]|jgi:tRNA (cmo5U34)-methyltransferase|nr:class I SAM-dependent methyltransferase [Verrucomicrobiales bacterium]